MQAENGSLKRAKIMIGEVKVRGKREVKFEKKNGLLYQDFKHPSVNQGEPVRQVVVPRPLREQIMHLAHNSLMGGHDEYERPRTEFLPNSTDQPYRGDVTRYCRLCNVCQQTVQKGTIPRAPLQRMPLTDSLFKESGWSYPSGQ